ncbi:hypothetical protein Psch_01720 [Pelotomaculum schinkii]|uniref:Uncharacterized protein n=1 Tax=Pelotomaculum schinkii TaxID=78350 RepID=A0A4Y7RGM1_9FIRM|nr:hypothetical protein [Pelotomaculum schinkii]TEB08165.1 hypothetical protein Psch_01720 [Pelotomaculum schinkii]
MKLNMQPGDVLVFEAGDDWIGKSIAFLTKSTVSHSAMALEEFRIVEMGPHGIVSPGVHADEKGRKVYLLRLEPGRPAQPLLQAAEAYLREGVAFDFPALFLLAGLLIYRAIRPTPKLQQLTDLVLRSVCKGLDVFINRLRQRGHAQKVMVCSQFVYQCYRDCGEDYQIHLQGGDLQNGMNMGDTNENIRLIDLLEQSGPINTNLVDMHSPEESGICSDPQQLARELYAALTESDPNEMPAGADMRALLPVVQKFLELVEQILRETEQDIPINALFVTPDDLLHHAKNLRVVETAYITRD